MDRLARKYIWRILCKAKEEGGVGIRKAKEMNNALLARLGWKLINEQESLWSRVLLSKYGGGREGLNVLAPKQGASHTWRGIINSSNVIREVEMDDYEWQKNQILGR